MSVNIPTHYAQQYTTNVQLLLQQRGSKLANTVMMGNHVGKAAVPVDQIGAVEAQVVSSRYEAKQRQDAPTDRRWVHPTDYDLDQIIDSFDKLRLLTDPMSAYVTNGMMAMGRAMDDAIISSFFGASTTGEDGSSTTSFPAANQVAVDYEAASANGLTVKKLKEAKRLLMSFEVDLDFDPLFCPITARQHADLLDEIQVTSRDFNDKPVLVDGKLSQFLGINFIHCERLDTDSNSYRRVPVYAKSGMHLGKWNEISSSIKQRVDLRGEPFGVYLMGTFGATRLEENKVIEIKCSEA